MAIKKLMDANAIKLAIDQYNDATGFIQIMNANHFDDWLINKAIVAPTSSLTSVGSNLIILEPTDDIRIGDLVYCSGFDTYSVVLDVEKFYSDETGLPFCSCPSLPLGPARVLPPTGTWIATHITTADTIQTEMAIGELVTFAIGAPKNVTIPDTIQISLRGIPN